MTYAHIAVALPVMGELDNITPMLDQLRQQSHKAFTLYVCVNQPEGDDCYFAENQKTLQLLNAVEDIDIVVIDRSSAGKGWMGKKKGVGWARKELFSRIMDECDNQELIISMDADTAFSPTYLESVVTAMNHHPEWSGLCIPYYHPLSGNEAQDRAMLRYECYMRHYLINLLLIGSPYAFSALGSAMAFPLWAYRRVGGITPLQGGEDFYLMQKFCKTGIIGKQFNECVRPQGRRSNRVPFGTGPAIAKGIDSMTNSYPFYPEEGFKAVGSTFALIPDLYEQDVETPMSAFLREQLKEEDLWSPLRKNFKTKELFSHAVQERIDGLRILQYLKTIHEKEPAQRDETHLISFCKNHGISISDNFSFIHSPVAVLNETRDRLFELEMKLR